MIIIGAGGHAHAVIALWRALGEEPLGLLADDGPAEVMGLRRLGTPARAGEWRARGVERACIAIGDNAARSRLGAELSRLGFALPAAVHPSAVVMDDARISDGCVVMPRAVLGAAATLGPFCILNTAAVLDHEGRAGEAAHIAIGAVLAGGVQVGARAFIGAGAAVLPKLVVGDDAVVGAGAVVLRDVPAGTRVAGVPARAISA